MPQPSYWKARWGQCQGTYAASQSWGESQTCWSRWPLGWCREDKWLDNEVILQAKSMMARKVVFKNVADKHWIRAQKDDLVLHHIQDWLTRPKRGQANPVRIPEWVSTWYRPIGLQLLTERILSWRESWCTWRQMLPVLKTGS